MGRAAPWNHLRAAGLTESRAFHWCDFYQKRASTFLLFDAWSDDVVRIPNGSRAHICPAVSVQRPSGIEATALGLSQR